MKRAEFISSVFYLSLKKIIIMQKFECLESIVGVTKDFCQCLHGQIDETEFQEVNKSNSGLFLDNVEGGLFLRNVPQLDKCKSFFDIQVEAIKNAKNFFSADILAELNLKYQVKKTNYFGEIGKINYTASMNTTKRLQFLKLQPNNDGVVQIDRIRVFLNQTVTTKAWIVKIEENQTEGEIIFENEAVSTVNNILTIPFPEGLKLPLNVNGKKQNYFVVYERLGSVQPRDLKVSCGCSGGDGFAPFLFVTGGEAETFSEIGTSLTDVFTHGISLDVQIKCETGSVICKEYNENDAIAYVTAFAILYKSAELVIENVMNSSEVNRFTMLSREHLWGKRSHFKKEYENRIRYLSENIDVTSSDCFLCRENTLYVGKILN